jgi:hypothetical protein
MGCAAGAVVDFGDVCGAGVGAVCGVGAVSGFTIGGFSAGGDVGAGAVVCAVAASADTLSNVAAPTSRRGFSVFIVTPSL